MTKYSWLNKMGLLWVIWSLGSWLWEFDPLVVKQSISSGTSLCVKAAHYIQRCAAEASLYSVLPLPFPSFLLFNFPLLWTGTDCCLDNRMPSFSPAWKVNLPWLSAGKGRNKPKKNAWRFRRGGANGAHWWNERCVLLCLQQQTECSTQQTNQDSSKKEKKKAKLLSYRIN